PSSTFSFTTGIALPSVALPATPANGATDQSRTPTLVWSASTGATTYDLYLGLSNPPAVYAQYLTGTSYPVTLALAPGTTYYWNVVARNGAGAAAASVTYWFTTAA